MLKLNKYLVLGLIVIFTIYVFLNKKWFITEHLSNPPPTLSSLETELETTNDKLNKLTSDFNAMKTKAEAQSQDAAAAKASLSAIH
jgi:hypothetical protein